MELKILRLCSNCNKEFELKDVDHNVCLRSSISNFENCPHCNQRNDTWVKIEWPIDLKL